MAASAPGPIDADLLSSRLASLALDAEVPNLAQEITHDLLARRKHIGAGGFGDVFRLDHPTRGQLAVKQIKEAGSVAAIKKQRQLARKEAAIWHAFTHPHVLKLVGILESETSFCFVCPFVKHGSLADYIRHNPSTKLDRIRVIIECVDALNYLHKKGIIHGDIKAANVLLSEDLHAQVCDFGLSRSVDTATATLMTGKGSIRWMSPELLDNGGGKTFYSDMWATGMMIYEILSGYIPFKTHTWDVVIITEVLIKRRLPDMQPTHSPTGESYETVWSIVSDCWKFDPLERPSMETLLRKLLPLRPPPPPLTGPIRGPTIRNNITDKEWARQMTKRPRERVTIVADEARAFCVTFSPDSRTLAAALNDHTIRFWDVAQAAEIGSPLIGHSNAVRAVAFSPDGTSLVSGSDDLSLRIWGVDTGRTRGEPLIGHTSWIWSVVFSPDGRSIASGASDNTVRIWDAESASCIAVLEGHTYMVTSVAYSPDGKILASCAGDHSIRLWDTETRALIGEPLTGHKDFVRSIAFSPDGTKLVAGSNNNFLRIWSLGSEMEHGPWVEAHRGAVSSLAVHPSGRFVASGSVENEIRIWDITEVPPRNVQILQGFGDDVNSVAFSADGRWLASGSDDQTVQLWDLKIVLDGR